MLWTYVINDLNEEEIADFFFTKKNCKNKREFKLKT